METAEHRQEFSPPPSPLLRSSSDSRVTKSLPYHAFRSNADAGRDQIIGIDRHTGLPKLQIEFLSPDMDEQDDRRRTLPVTKAEIQADKPSRASPSSSHRDIHHTHSVDDNTNLYWKKRQAQLKTRSRSVFIKLQRTPPSQHRSIPIPESDGSDTDIRTAPVLSGKESRFTFLQKKGEQRRCSEDLRTSLSQCSLPEEGDTCEILPNSLPSISKFGSLTRRTSFFHQSDTEDDQPVGPTGRPISRTPSMGSHVGDETYVTPFAQILANLHRVRSQFIVLMGLPEDYRSGNPHSHTHSMSPFQLPHHNPQPSEELHRQMAVDTLDELDWCLRKLESVDSAKSMGAMARDKFQRILSRELLQMSEKSKSGSHVAEWVHTITNWDRGEAVDRVLDKETMASPTHREPSPLDHTLSASLRHDDWTKLNVRMGRRSPQRSPSPLQLDVPNYCERVPTYGISVPGMDHKKLKEFMERDIDLWGVDTFYLSSITGGNPLITASYQIFKKRKLFIEFKIPPPTFINFMAAVQTNYLPNPYHNPAHAADVIINTNFLLKARALEDVFSNLEILATLVAAAVHDVGHPGKSNQFLVNIGSELAMLYNDISVLENHHLAVAFKLLQDPSCNFMVHLVREQRQAFRKMVIDMVLATDMSCHFRHLGELKTLLETKKVANDGILLLDKYNDRSEVLQCLLHCADLANPSKPVEIAKEWSLRVMEEAFLQGDEEKKRGIPLNPLGDREQVCIEKCQMTFIDLIVYPLWETWGELVYPDAQEVLENISKTREYWSSHIPNSPPQSEWEGEKDSSTGTGSDIGEEEEVLVQPVANGNDRYHGLETKNPGHSGGVVAATHRSEDRIPVMEMVQCIESNKTESNDSVLRNFSIGRPVPSRCSPANERRTSFAATKEMAMEEDLENEVPRLPSHREHYLHH